MTLGDGIRRDIAKVSPAERLRFRDAILQLDVDLVYPGGPSKWDMQDAIHQATHVHNGPSFLPWHRELCNRFEAMLREADPDLSLHYWDWTTDPRAAPDGSGGVVNLFTNDFMGSSSGAIGGPLAALGAITRGLDPGAPGVPADSVIVNTGSGAPVNDQYRRFRERLEGEHGSAIYPGFNVHGYIGGTIGNPHSAFEDPFVFLLHSNVDRIFAMWQAQPGSSWRLDPNQVYGLEGTTTGETGITTAMEPWAGIDTALRPWAPPENQQYVKTSKHPTIVKPPCYDTLPINVSLVTPVSAGAPITFNDVPDGATAVRAAVFSIFSCRHLHFEVTAGPGAPYTLVQAMPVEVAPTPTFSGEARVWISFHAAALGPAGSGSVTIRCQETAQQWVIPITGNVIPWPTVASVMVLDKSGSMDWASGIPGYRRIDVLKAAAPVFVEMLPDNDGVGVVSFDHDAYPVTPVALAGIPVIGGGRLAAKSAITGHASSGGATAIGDGVELAHNTLQPLGGFAHKAMIVFTDGHETDAKYISDVAGFINERVFAIGLGTSQQLNPAALSALARGTGGYLLMTDNLGSNDLLRLHKYFLQILAGVTNAAIVIDPESAELPGQEHRIPFQLTEADFRSDVILLSPAPWAFDFALETPDGDLIGEADASVIPGMSFIAGDQVHSFRMTLPVPVGNGAREGTWHAVLRVEEGNYKEYLTMLRRKEQFQFQQVLAHGVPYIVNVQAHSNLRMHVDVLQASLAPGATVTLRARLTEYDQPLLGSGGVAVEITRPDATTGTLHLAEIETGVFEAGFQASLPGIYRLLFRGSGKTLRGQPFTREELRTAPVWARGDDPPPSGNDDPRDRDRQLCHLVECLLREESLARFFEQHGLDRQAIERCIRRFCAAGGPTPESSIDPAKTAVAAGEIGDLFSQPGARDLVARLAELVERDRR